MISTTDEVWSDDTHPMVATISAAELSNHEKQLLSQLNIEGAGTPEDHKALKKLLCSMNTVFALTEHELGETGLVEHKIKLEEGKQAVRTTPRRLP